MKFAILSDIHGNLPAMRAAIADAMRLGADGYILAGDYCLSSPYPNGVIDEMRALHSAHIVQGNEERYLSEREGGDERAWTDGQYEITYWVMRNTTADNRRYLRELPEQTAFEAGGVKIHVAHSSEAFIGGAEHSRFRTSTIPGRYGRVADRAALLRDVRATIAAHPDYLRAKAALQQGVYIFGHSHIQWHAQIGGHVFINPGSCGLPLDLEAPGAPYTLLTVENGKIEVAERRVDYGMEEYARSLRDSDQYRRARVWTELVMRELQTRREAVDFFLLFADRFARSIGDERRPFAKDTWEAAYAAWADLPDAQLVAMERARYLQSMEDA